jgi:CheY-like chemotaxis protein
MSVVSASPSDLQILIVSDDVPTRQLLASGLEKPSRVHVTTTADGAGAIALLSSARYRVVILALPVVARELLLDDMVRRSDPTPVILIMDPEERPPQRPYPSNVKHLLAKPIQLPRLKVLIENLDRPSGR